MYTLTLILSCLCGFVTIQASTAPYLTATALVTTAENTSALQCWEFLKPLTMSNVAGVSGAATFRLSNSSDVVLTSIPPFFDGGLHTAPAVQFVVFLTGLAHITLPSSSTSAYILGGSASSLIVAADTSGTGHYTNYPSGDFTTALQVPVKGGIEAIPAYRVLDGEGPCRNAQQIGAKTSLMQRVLETVGRHHNRDEPTGEMENGGRREL